MPLELGLFLAAKKFGGGRQRQKKCIIFDKKPYRYQQFISDISGQDIHSHKNDVSQLISKLAAWLRDERVDPQVPGGNIIAADFRKFQREFPRLCRDTRLHPDELTFQDYRKMAARWVVATRS
jgi:hypothetical protein